MRIREAWRADQIIGPQIFHQPLGNSIYDVRRCRFILEYNGCQDRAEGVFLCHEEQARCQRQSFAS